MDSQRVLEKVEDLEDSLANLQELLEPLLNSSLNAASRKLPLLDRAKLNVTVVYAIESLLFSYLRINGVDAKEHAVFKELSRIRSYFDKLKAADDKQKKPTLVLDKAATNRIIAHDLGTEQRKKQQAEESIRRMKILKEQILAKRKSASAPQTPAPELASPGVQREPIDPSELLDSISKEIEMQDEEQEGSEEGEIEESPSTIPPRPEHPDPVPQAHLQTKKRKHVHGQNGKMTTNEQRLSKKQRKRAKNKNLH